MIRIALCLGLVGMLSACGGLSPAQKESVLNVLESSSVAVRNGVALHIDLHESRYLGQLGEEVRKRASDCQWTNQSVGGTKCPVAFRHTSWETVGTGYKFEIDYKLQDPSLKALNDVTKFDLVAYDKRGTARGTTTVSGNLESTRYGSVRYSATVEWGLPGDAGTIALEMVFPDYKVVVNVSYDGQVPTETNPYLYSRVTGISMNGENIDFSSVNSRLTEVFRTFNCSMSGC